MRLRQWFLALAMVALSGMIQGQSEELNRSMAEPPANSENLAIPIVLLNYPQPFITEKLAAKIVRAIVEERYHDPSFFRPSDEANIVDEGEFWTVTYKNLVVPDNESSILPRRAGFTIRKTNGEIVDIAN
jgi:hypothetical protein